MTSLQECPVCFDEFNEDATDYSDNEDSDDDGIFYVDISEEYLDDSEYVYDITPGIINTYKMTEGSSDWWNYEVHFDVDGEQEKVYIENQSGKSLQSGKHLFVYKVNGTICDRVILKNEDFKHPNWIKVFAYSTA